MFPTRQDSGGRSYISPYEGDYRSANRFIDLPNGSVAVLNACYDAFGTADTGTGTNTRRHAIRRILTQRGKVLAGDPAFREVRDRALDDWTELLADRRPEVLLATIHAFEGPGRDGYWQRHGIARASASLHGALVAGAAHFKESLPGPAASTLAACGVPRSHILAGASRLARSLAPTRSQSFETTTGLKAILRLFEPPPGKWPPAARAGKR
jgi:hypothetical protein